MFKKRWITIGGIVLFVCLCFTIIYGVDFKFTYKEMAPSSFNHRNSSLEKSDHQRYSISSVHPLDNRFFYSASGLSVSDRFSLHVKENLDRQPWVEF